MYSLPIDVDAATNGITEEVSLIFFLSFANIHFY